MVRFGEKGGAMLRLFIFINFSGLRLIKIDGYGCANQRNPRETLSSNYNRGKQHNSMNRRYRTIVGK